LIFHTNNGRLKRYFSEEAGRQNCRVQERKEFISVQSCLADGQRETTCPETGKRKTQCNGFNRLSQTCWLFRHSTVPAFSLEFVHVFKPEHGTHRHQTLSCLMGGQAVETSSKNNGSMSCISSVAFGRWNVVFAHFKF